MSENSYICPITAEILGPYLCPNLHYSKLYILFSSPNYCFYNISDLNKLYRIHICNHVFILYFQSNRLRACSMVGLKIYLQ